MSDEEKQKERNEREKERESICIFQVRLRNGGNSLKLIRQTARPDYGAGKGTVKCVPSLHSRFPFTFLHSANLRWITSGVFNSVFVVLSEIASSIMRRAELRFCAMRALRSFCMNRRFHIPIFEYPDCACYSEICLYEKMQDKLLPDFTWLFSDYTDSCG